MHVLQKLCPSSSKVIQGGSCPPNAIPTFNGPNAINNIQMIFINKENSLKQIIILMKINRTKPALSGQIPHWKE